MPFHDSVYYPYAGGPDAQGTHSSAGVPSLLNSPSLIQQQHLLSDSSSTSHHHHHHPNNAATMTPTPPPPPSTLPPFRFRARRESVDWRRVGALDVERVASELDLDALQQHVTAVAFCSLEGEQCPRCRAPVDPALVKLFRLAQLTVEWLLHCQAALAEHLRAAEQRLAAAGAEREALAAQHARLEERGRALTGELRQRKKVIRTQQSMLGPRCLGSHKCTHCDKSFLNASFLQNHLHRRHPDVLETQSPSDSEKKSQLDVLKAEISGLKEQLAQQQQTLLAKTAQEKEQESLQRDLVRELDRFKAEEMARMDRKIEDSRDGIRREMREFLYTQNFQARIEQEHSLMSRRETASSPEQRHGEREQEAYADAQAHAMQRLEQQLRKQDKKWESKMQDIKTQHESEKNQLLTELSRMQVSVGEQQGRGQRSLDEMERRLQERERTITAQREQIKNLSSQQMPTKIVEVPVIVTATPPEPRHKRVAREEAPSTAPPCQSLDPIQEMSEEDRDSSSVSERRRPPVATAESRRAEPAPAPAPERREKVTPAALRRNPGLRKELRPALEQALADKLEDLGVRPGQSGLKHKELSGIMSRVVSARETAAREVRQYWQHREEVERDLDRRLQDQRRGSEPAAGPPRAKANGAGLASQNRPRSSSLPSRVTQVMSGPPAKQAKTPQPVPRTRTADRPKTTTGRAGTLAKASVPKTPPFSSDEDTEEEEDTEDDEEKDDERDLTRLRGPSQDPKGRSPQVSRPHQVPAVLQDPARRPSPAMRQQTPARPALAPKHVQQRPAATNVVKAAIKAPDSEDDDWSEVSELQEIAPKRLQANEDRNGTADKRPAVKQATVRELAGKVERQLAERGAQRPTGGVNVAPKTTKKEKEDVVQELVYTDLEESSDWAVSSLEEPGHILALSKSGPQGPLATRKSLDSSSTSVWGTSTGRGQKSGLPEAAGTGSTLKSSLISLSDFSDSEEI